MQTLNIGRFNKFFKASAAINKAVDNKTALYRLKVLDFYKQHGLAAALDAFNISRATLFNWQKLHKAHGARGLIPCSTRPLHCRQSQIPRRIERFILDYRAHHPRVCQYTIKPGLDEFCKKNNLSAISTFSIERIIRKLKERGEIISNNPSKTYRQPAQTLRQEKA
jgi:hypothetical protein